MFGFINGVKFATANHFHFKVFCFAFIESFPAESSCFAYSHNIEIAYNENITNSENIAKIIESGIAQTKQHAACYSSSWN